MAYLPLQPTRPPRGFLAGAPPQDGSPETWGPPQWHDIHVDAIFFPVAPTPEQSEQERVRLWARMHGLPCGACRGHAARYLRRYPPDLSGTLGYQRWAWRFHNAVNRRLGKPLMGATKYRERYASQLREAAAARA